MFYPICTSLDRIQSFTLDLNWNGSKRVHFGERPQTGTDSGSVPVRIQQVQCRRKAYLYPYWYGSVWIRSSVNGVLNVALSIAALLRSLLKCCLLEIHLPDLADTLIYYYFQYDIYCLEATNFLLDFKNCYFSCFSTTILV